MSFFTAINCMDGRVQLPVVHYLQRRFLVEYIDMITEPGPNRIVAENTDTTAMDSIFKRMDISVNGHKSKGIAIVGHHDCLGNPTPKEEQLQHIRQAKEVLAKKYPQSEIIGLWVDADWVVSEVD